MRTHEEMNGNKLRPHIWEQEMKVWWEYGSGERFHVRRDPVSRWTVTHMGQSRITSKKYIA